MNKYYYFISNYFFNLIYGVGLKVRPYSNRITTVAGATGVFVPIFAYRAISYGLNLALPIIFNSATPAVNSVRDTSTIGIPAKLVVGAAYFLGAKFGSMLIRQKIQNYTEENNYRELQFTKDEVEKDTSGWLCHVPGAFLGFAIVNPNTTLNTVANTVVSTANAFTGWPGIVLGTAASAVAGLAAIEYCGQQR